MFRLFIVIKVVFLLGLAGYVFVIKGEPTKAPLRGYVFDGGTQAERAEVRKALAASSFDWNLVPARVTIHIETTALSHAEPGHVHLDRRLLRHGRKAWAIVQHEYAHQVDFFLFDDDLRAELLEVLGGDEWLSQDDDQEALATPHSPGAEHARLGAERFASSLAWAYWPSKDNVLPRLAPDETNIMRPARFRALVAEVLRTRVDLDGVNVQA